MEAQFLHTGELYAPDDPDLLAEQAKYQDRIADYNLTRPSQKEDRARMLREMLADCGEDVYIEAPFFANWGGHHLHVGERVYINYGLTCVDDTDIWIGSDTLIGPNVTIATASHPTDPVRRSGAMQFNRPVFVGKECWIGAGVIICPGVHVGDGTTIGAGSVVTKDMPSRVVAVGNPCRVIRSACDDTPARSGEFHRGCADQ